ncbi:MAG: glycosyltransferase family 2 protein [bacterium]|nr:glycosyltransferase family 2 protein [bacterium]
MAESDSLSIIIVSYNSALPLIECLRSLPEAAPEIIQEIIIVDNGSTDEISTVVAKICPEAKLIKLEKNRGFAAGCNAGAAKARGTWLLFLNPDCILDPGSVRRLIAAMRQYRNVGLATMRLRNPDRSFQANCRNFPTVNNLLFSRGSVMGRLVWEKLSKKATVYTLPDYTDVTIVPAVSATAMGISRRLFQALKGFDERYFLYMEDTDLSYRVHLHKHQNIFVPQAGAVHGWGRGSTGGKIFRAWHHHQSVWKYFLKFQATGFALIILPAILMLNFLLVCLLPDKRGRA